MESGFPARWCGAGGRDDKRENGDDEASTDHIRTIRLVRLVAIGLAAGVFSAFFGVGGGILVVPLLILLVHLPERVAAATSLLAIAITATAGVVVFSLRGEVDVAYAALVGLPAAVGALAGTSLQQRVTTSTLTLGFAALLAGTGVWLLVS
ncbi:MAG TPA: sulfite exporter TauE/SafE family protein [Gaiellaceae bacterium]|nr:sulfite exporter TauE/SafE family protein [Gaiellaceae bacterium]